MEDSIFNKSLEQLDGDFLEVPDPKTVTGLIHRVLSLRKKPLKDLTIDELRVCISQNEGTPFVVPIAISVLEADPLAGNFPFPGALLLAILRSPKKFWNEHPLDKERVLTLFTSNAFQTITASDLTDEIKADLFLAFAMFSFG